VFVSSALPLAVEASSRRAVLAALAMAAALVSGCGALCPAPGPLAAPPRDDAPLLRLPPQALGRSLALQQQLTVDVRGQPERRLDVMLEADPSAVRLALVGPGGQTAARLEWDGLRLDETRAPWLPAAVSSERILSDLQLVLWPAAAIRSALPAGWSLVQDGDRADAPRVLRQQAEDVVTVSYPSATRAELVQHRAGYTLVIDSRPVPEDRP
jgi:hypothetical protein